MSRWRCGSRASTGGGIGSWSLARYTAGFQGTRNARLRGRGPYLSDCAPDSPGRPWQEGYVFSRDGVTPIEDGSWIKGEWRRAQIRAGIRTPITWHDLRHVFVSLLIAAGKHPKYIADAARHRDPGFSLRVCGHLFESMPITSVEWWDDLLWPAGCPYVPAAEPATDGARGVPREPLKAETPR